MQMCSRCFSALLPLPYAGMGSRRQGWQIGIGARGNFSVVPSRNFGAAKPPAVVCLGLDRLQIQPPFRGSFKNRNQILSEAHNPVLLCLPPFAFRLPTAPTPPSFPAQCFTGSTGLGFSGSRWWER